MDYNEQNLEYVKLIQDNTLSEKERQDTYTKLVEFNEPIIRRLLSQFFSKMRFHEKDDMRQEAIMGLVRASQTFDLSRDDIKFSTYAIHCMKRSMLTLHKNNKSSDLRGFAPDIRRLAQFKTDYALANNGKEPSQEEILEALQIKPYEYAIIRGIGNGEAISLDSDRSKKRENGDRKESKLVDVLADEGLNFFDSVIIEEDKKALLEEIQKLPGAQAYVIYRAFFEGETYEAIAKDLGITRSRVGQVEQNAVKRLKENMLKNQIWKDKIPKSNDLEK